MRYLNIPCAYCGELFVEGDDIVTCPACGTPQHRSCWSEHGCCANASLHNSGFAWNAPKTAGENTGKTMIAAAGEKETAEDVTECPFCGAKNYANELYCAACHEPIHPNASARSGSPLEDEEQRELMVKDFHVYGGFNPQEKIDGISIQEYASYVGGKSGGYVRRFVQMRRNRITWNWAAFWSSAVSMICSIAFGPVWFFYRKLNKIGVVFLCVLLALSAIGACICMIDPAYWEYMDRMQELYFGSLELSQQAGADVGQIVDDMYANMSVAIQTYAETCSKVTRYWSYISNTLYSYVLPILAGFFATGFYYKKAKQDILSVREQYGQSPDYLQKLGKKGGVSVGAAVGAAASCFAIYVIMQYLPLVLRFFKIV